MMTKTEIAAALTAALAAPSTPTRASGCGRAYVCVILSKAELTAFAAAAKAQGRIFQRRGYGVSNALYVGYDNGTGRELGKAEAIAAALSAAGISAYTDAVGD